MEEDLEDTVSHLSIYLAGLDQLHRETAAQLKHQIRQTEKAHKEMEKLRRKATIAQKQAESHLEAFHKLQSSIQEEEQSKSRRRRGIGGWISEDEWTSEEEPEETHWDKGTQTEDWELEQCLPPKKRPRQDEESP